MEILIGSPEIRDAIKDPHGLTTIQDLIAQGGALGMRTLDQHLVRLVEEGTISAETARAAVADPDSLRLVGETKPKRKSKG